MFSDDGTIEVECPDCGATFSMHPSHPLYEEKRLEQVELLQREAHPEVNEEEP